MTKVILIEPNQQPKIIDYNNSIKAKLFSNAVMDYIALRAPENENMILSMSGFDTTTGMKYNRVATEYASYLRRYFRYQENNIYGPVIIIGDNEDMNDEKHEILKRMILLKKQNNREGCNNKSYLKFANETLDGVVEKRGNNLTLPDNIGTAGNFSLPNDVKIGNFTPGGYFPGATKITLGDEVWVMARKVIAANLKKVTKEIADEEERIKNMNDTANIIAMALKGGARITGVNGSA